MPIILSYYHLFDKSSADLYYGSMWWSRKFHIFVVIPGLLYYNIMSLILLTIHFLIIYDFAV